ncbi:Rieske domain protein [Penicillium sp. IBT 18751x]|nr:Rieske domain protein [Penicillium sp. IBT 18751x]
MNPFTFLTQSRANAAWHPVGLASALPDLDLDKDAYRIAPRCKAFTIPKNEVNSEAKPPVEADIDMPGDLKDQVLVFKYKGKIHAVDHQCPHSAFPLSQGNIFDIEDFGITLSSGISCPKHDWSFDLHTGRGDRGSYTLKLWEVQLRDPSSPDELTKDDKEVWVRRKQKIG